MAKTVKDVVLFFWEAGLAGPRPGSRPGRHPKGPAWEAGRLALGRG